jgi:hypothetical protein
MKKVMMLLCIIGVVCFFSGQVLAYEYTFTTIDYPGANGTVANDSNNAGQIVGYYWDSNKSIPYGFLYNGSTFIILDYPGARPDKC